MSAPRRLRGKTCSAISLTNATSRVNSLPCLQGTGFRGYYDVLGVQRSASASEVKAAFKRRALLTHPDKNQALDAALQFNLVFQAHETLAFEDRRLAYDAELAFDKNSDGLHGTDVRPTAGILHRNLSFELGNARVLWEQSLLQDNVSLDTQPLEVLLALQRLIDEPKEGIVENNSQLVHNRDIKGLSRSHDGYFKVYAQWAKFCVECDRTRSLERAVDFHAELTALKNRSLLQENYVRGPLLEEELFRALRAEPRLQLSYRLRIDAKVSVTFRDLRMAVKFAQEFPTSEQRSRNRWFAQAKSCAQTSKKQRSHRSAMLPTKLAAALAVHAKDLQSRLREAAESKGRTNYARLLSALKLTPQTAATLCNRLEALPELELKRRREALFARSDVGIVKDVAKRRKTLAHCTVDEPPLEIPSIHAQVSSHSWLGQPSFTDGILVTTFFSCVDAAPIRAVSKLALASMKTTASELLRDFQYRPGCALIGFPEKRSMRGRIIRQAPVRPVHGGPRHFLIPFLQAHAGFFKHLDLSQAEPHASDCFGQPHFRVIVNRMGQLGKAVFPSRAFQSTRDKRLLSDSCPGTCTVLFY